MLYRTLMMLKGGDYKGTLRLVRENGGLKVSVTVPGLAPGETYRAYLFYSEEKSALAGELEGGKLQGTLAAEGDAMACCITKTVRDGEVVVLTGETGEFDWDRAKSLLYLKQAAKREENPLPAPLPTSEADEMQPMPLPTSEANQPAQPDGLLDRYYESAAQEPFVSSLRNLEDALHAPEPETPTPSDGEEEMMLRAREAFEQTQQEADGNCPINAKKTIVRPFSRQYAEYVWEKTEFPGLKGCWHYLTGRLYENGALKKVVIGVPGEYAANPPNWLYGFDTYAYADEGEAKGYWLLFEDA